MYFPHITNFQKIDFDFYSEAVTRPKACNIIKKEIPTQVFSCEFCKILKNTFVYKTPQVALSVYSVC